MTSHKPAKFSDYFWHLRPKSWPIVFLHCAVGGELALSKNLAGGWGAPAGGWFAPELGQIALGALLWAVFLNGGTLALNSGIDCDEGDIGYLNNPPSTPPGLTWFGLGVMTFGALLAASFFSKVYLCLYLSCVALSILYSTPPVRLKAVAGGDLLINMVGYGALTILAGYFSVEVELRKVAILAACGFAFLFGALYPTTQIYQLKEDIRSGARGLTVQLGVRNSLKMACLFLGLAFAFFGAIHVIYQTGWIGMTACFISLVAWLIVLIPWSVKLDAYPHQQGMYRALWAWALTESLLAVVWLGQAL